MKYLSAVLLFMSSIFTFGNPSRLGVPDELEATLFSSKELTPCVACLCVAPTGEVYAGIDQIGSLGKGAGFGRILRLTDQDNDGVSDGHTVYAEIDNPRGMISVGDIAVKRTGNIPSKSNTTSIFFILLRNTFLNLFNQN